MLIRGGRLFDIMVSGARRLLGGVEHGRLLVNKTPHCKSCKQLLAQTTHSRH